VTDGHHNRVLFAELSGEIAEVAQYADIVPTGLQVDGSKVLKAEAGPRADLGNRDRGAQRVPVPRVSPARQFRRAKESAEFHAVRASNVEHRPRLDVW
jgi:hypothetical protein